jgi:hypothetical protein
MEVIFGEFKPMHAQLQSDIYQAEVKVGPFAYVGQWVIEDFWSEGFKISEPKGITDGSIRLLPDHRDAIIRAIRSKRAEIIREKRGG